MGFNLSQVLGPWLMTIKAGFAVVMLLVVLFLAWKEQHRAEKEERDRRLRMFPQSPEARIANFRKRYERSVRTGTR